MTPLTPKQKELIAKNVIAACKDIKKLNERGYRFLNMCSGFIAHYDLGGFKAYYYEHDLQEDLGRYARQNQWANFRAGESNADYYHSKRDCYNMILGGLAAQEFINRYEHSFA